MNTADLSRSLVSIGFVMLDVSDFLSVIMSTITFFFLPVFGRFMLDDLLPVLLN